MVNYKIGISNRKESRVVDLDSIIKIKDLKNLDQLTSTFKSEDELKLYLFNQGLISKDELRQNVSVMYKYRGKVKKLPIIYQDMKKYFDIDYLKYTLMGLSNNIEFLEKLARHYSIGNEKHNPQGLNVSDIRRYISDVRVNKGQTFYSKMLELAIDDLWKKAVFKLVDRSTGEIKENYRGTRDLAMFIYKFKKHLEEKVSVEIKEEFKFQDNNEDCAQISLFDMLNQQKNTSIDSKLKEEKNNDEKWTLSSEGEPDFPPNSYEEALYNRYKERLEELADQNIDPYDEFYGSKRR